MTDFLKTLLLINGVVAVAFLAFYFLVTPAHAMSAAENEAGSQAMAEVVASMVFGDDDDGDSE